MTRQINWFLAPTEPHPSGDPLMLRVPSAAVRSACRGWYHVLLPGDGLWCLVRATGDQAALDGVMAGKPPAGTARLSRTTTWSAIPGAVRTRVMSNWPTVGGRMRPTDTLDVLVRRLYELATNRAFTDGLFTQPTIDQGAEVL